MADPDPFREHLLLRLRLGAYFLPLVGLVPSIWQLTQTPTTALDRRYQALSRRSLRLTLGWLALYLLLWMGGTLAPEVSGLRFLYLNALVTSGYFVTCLGAIARLVLTRPKA